jgi:hypothetical protein
VKRLLLALLLSTTALAHAQGLSKALVVPTCTPGRELEETAPGLQQLTQDTQGRLCAAATNAGSVNMVTPLMVSAVGPPATAVFGQNPFGSNWNAATLRASPSPIPGTISNLTVSTQNVIAVGQYTFALWVGASTALQCSVGQGGINLGTTQRCSDTTDTIDVYAGDLLAWQSTPVGTPTVTGQMSISALFTSANGQESLIGGATNNFMVTTAISYLGPSTLAAVTANELGASVVMPTAGILDYLYISLGSPVAINSSIQFTVFKNGIATGIVATCTNPGLTCHDLTHALNVVAGDTISLQICPSNIAGCPAGVASGGPTMGFSLRWQPTVLHQAVLFNTANANSPATNHTTMAAGGGWSTNETIYQNIVPATMTLGNLIAAQCPDVSATVPRVVTLRSNGASQAPSVTLPLGTEVCPTMSMAQDTTDTYEASAGELLNYLSTASGGLTATNFKTSMTAIVP